RTKLGEALVRAGLTDDGMTELRTAAEQSPTDPIVLFALGNASSTLGDPDGAVEYFRETLRLQPTFARAHHNLAN
ncbi:MAG: tetratricopeptide repeat protein, partial [Phycisphaerales bacterium]